jgi:hypothetical protein
MRGGITRGLYQRLNDVGRRRQVGVPYSERDDIDTARFGLGDLAIDLGEQVRGQSVDAAGGPQDGSPLKASRSTSPSNDFTTGPVR